MSPLVGPPLRSAFPENGTPGAGGERGVPPLAAGLPLLAWGAEILGERRRRMEEVAGEAPGPTLGERVRGIGDRGERRGREGGSLAMDVNPRGICGSRD